MNTRSTQQAQHARRILVADPLKLFADACKAVVEPEFDVVAIVTDGAEIPEVVARVAPGVIVADAEMPRIDTLKSLGKYWGEKPAPKIVMLTTRFGSEICVEQFRLGASAIVSKQSDAHELVTALRSVVAGEHYISPNMTRAAVESVVREATSSKRRRLTDRQQQIFTLLTQGMSAKEIAYRLGVSQGNVYFHKNRVMSALNMNSDAELLRYAIQQEGAN